MRFSRLLCWSRQISQIDGTNKFLFRLYDGNVVESVLMKYKYGNSVHFLPGRLQDGMCILCINDRRSGEKSLSTSEMLGQIYQIQKISGERVSNVVIMGTGELMDNYDNFLKFIHLLTDEHGLNISQRNVTVSTCGIVPSIKELAKEYLQITLALSLHGSNQEKRRKLMPVANKYDITEVLEACDEYFKQTGRRVSFEYSLVHGVNDTDEDVQELIHLLKHNNCHLNLIPVNPGKERDFVRQSRRKSAIEFQKVNLKKSGINVTIRREMGSDIDGACGQLRRRYVETEGEIEGMKTFSIKDVGMVRQVNQDYVFTTGKPLGHSPESVRGSGWYGWPSGRRLMLPSVRWK